MKLLAGVLLTAGLLIAGLWPHPIIRADWQSHYSRALNTGNCNEILEHQDLLRIVDHQRALFEVQEDLAQRQLCGAESWIKEGYLETFGEEISDEKYDKEHRRLTTFALQDTLNDVWYNSFLGSRLTFADIPGHFPGNPMFLRSIRQFQLTAPECQDKLITHSGKLPDQALLKYAFDQSLSADETRRIRDHGVQLCANIAIGHAITMVLTSHSDEEFDYALYWLSGAARYALQSSPSLYLDMLALEDVIPQHAINQAARSDTDVSLSNFLFSEDTLARLEERLRSIRG